MQTEEIDSDKLILGIPFYTRIWTVDANGEVLRNPTVNMEDIEGVIPDGVQKTNFKIENFHKDGGDKNNKWLVYVLRK